MPSERVWKEVLFWTVLIVGSVLTFWIIELTEQPSIARWRR
jgi:hypothetical protein